MTLGADELLTMEREKTKPGKRICLRYWLMEDRQKKIEEEAEKLGIKKKTLRNAKMELGIDSVKREISGIDVVREERKMV